MAAYSLEEMSLWARIARVKHAWQSMLRNQNWRLQAHAREVTEITYDLGNIMNQPPS